MNLAVYSKTHNQVNSFACESTRSLPGFLPKVTVLFRFAGIFYIGRIINEEMLPL